MIKKVVIAAAGQGTRMQDFSKNKSKHLIEVLKKPFLAYLLDNLIKAGYNQIIIVAGFKKDLIDEFVKTYLKGIKDGPELKIETVDQHKILGPKEKEYGTACPLKCVKNMIEEENFIYVYGDNLYSVEDLVSMNIEDDFCYVAGFKHQNPKKYGVLIKDKEGFLKEIIEKPATFVSNLINTGLYKFTQEIFRVLPLVKKSARGEYEITDAISLLARERKVKVKEIKKYWLDFGAPEDIKRVSDFLQNNFLQDQ